MRGLFVLFFSLYGVGVLAQVDSIRAIQEIRDFQTELNAEYKDPKKSPLDPEDVGKFEGHSFYPINLNYRVVATLSVIPDSPFLPMKTTSPKLSSQRVFGRAVFMLNGKVFEVPVYQSRDLMNIPEYKDYLFFPFTDLTNGDQTYGGGRYIDLKIPTTGTSLVIDFNRAYNPYCAYSHKYSCPIVPAENHIEMEITAGVRDKGK